MLHKHCPRCKTDKPVSGFAIRSNTRSRLTSWCRACSRESALERYYSNHAQQRARRKESTHRLRREKALKVYEYLKGHPCVDCGISDPLVLEFDHKNCADKTDAIAQLVNRNWSWHKIASEIEKCEVRCANCHRRRTATQFGYLRHEFIESESSIEQQTQAPSTGRTTFINLGDEHNYSSVKDFLRSRTLPSRTPYLGLRVASRAKSKCRAKQLTPQFAGHLGVNLYPVEILESALAEIRKEFT